jgi:peptidoglycan/LPS O-acetylase OafA/YrhL
MLVGIQCLRGAAASMVVMHHYLASQAEQGAAIPRWLLEFGGSGVDIFFVISGFIMAVTQAEPRASGGAAAGAFLHRRLLRVAPLYWVLTGLAFCLAMIAGPAVRTPIGPDKFLMSMAFLPYSITPLDMANTAHLAYVIPMAWTLTFEWLFYLVFAAALLLPMPAVGRLRFIAVAFVVLVASGLLMQPESLLLQVATSPLLFEFLLGCGAAMLYRRGWRLDAMLTLLLALCAGAVLAHGWHHDVYQRTVIWGLAAFVLILSASAGKPMAWMTAISRPFEHLGDISYSLYLSHFFTLALFVRLQHRVPMLADGTGWSAILAFAVLALVVAELCYWFIESPARRYVNTGAAAARGLAKAGA